MDKKDLTKAYGAAIFFSFLVGFSFMWIKTCIPYTDSIHILAHRFDFALLALILLVVFKAVKTDLKGKPKKNLLLTAGFYTGFIFFQVFGLYFATSIEGSIIFAAVPIMVQIIAAVFLGERPTWVQNIFVGVSVTALMVMVILGSNEISFNITGIVLLLLSSIFMALSNVYMRYIRTQYSPIEISTAIIVMGTVVFNLLFVIKSIVTDSDIGYLEPFRHGEYVIGVIYLGVGCILLSAQIMSYLQSKLQAAKASVFGNLSTAISIVAGAVILDESLRGYHIVCSCFIIAGVIGLNFFGKKPGKGKDKTELKGGEHEISVFNGK